MSGIKQVLFDLMEQDHEIAKRRNELFTEGEIAMAQYDHVRADEQNSTEGQEVED